MNQSFRQLVAQYCIKEKKKQFLREIKLPIGEKNGTFIEMIDKGKGESLAERKKRWEEIE